MAEKHAREVSEHREIVEEETQKGRKEAREKVVVEMEEMIEKGYGNVTFGSEGIRQREYTEREKGELEKNEVEKGQTGRIEYCRDVWRRQIGMKRKRFFGEKVRAETRRTKGRRTNRLVEMSVSS